jgi:hypothetical protein
MLKSKVARLLQLYSWNELLVGIITGGSMLRRVVLGSMVLAVATGCGIFNMKSSEQGQALSFSGWCTANKLQNCTVKANAVDAVAWNASLDIFKEVSTSGGALNFTRAQYEAASVRNFIRNFGGSAIFGLLEKLPWDQFTYSGGVYSLINRSNNAFTLNGLSIVGSGIKATIGSRVINFTGASLKFPNGKVEILKSIDLRSPGYMTILTDVSQVSGVPFEFLGVTTAANGNQFSPGSMIKGMSDIVNDKAVNWQKSISLVISNAQLNRMMAIIKGLAANNMLNSAIDSLAPAIRSITLGGLGAKPMVISMTTAKVCLIKLTGVPLLGALDTQFKLAASSGISSATVVAGVTKVKMFGFQTDLGAIEEINFSGDKGSIKLGLVTVPMDLSGKSPSTVAVKSISCS